jgi:anaerobic selenocysteine-containing dehydrogenase
MSHQEKLSFCRICMGHCGVRVTVDERDRIVSIRGDQDDTQTLGYACFKGMQSGAAHGNPDRILHPQKRMPDGSFQRIPLEQALSEIAEKTREILERDGAEAIGGYKGGGGFFTSSALMMLNEFLAALGSPKAFSSVTIDQSAKAVAAGRLGVWPAGRVPFDRGDCFLIVGGNPLVSLTTNGFDIRNPQKRLKEAKDRGMKLIIIDPRRTETAHFADLVLQPLPGEDPSVLAGLLHIIFREGWEDHAFCADHVADLAQLREAVEPFTPPYVAARADVPEDALYEVARTFAHQCSRGAASSCTGPDMSPHSNLAEHLVECLNIVCGRFLREGEEVGNPGAILPRWPRKAEVMPAAREWEGGYKSRIRGFGQLSGELPTGIMADDILEPGPGQLRALFVHGGNPASAVPDQRKIVKALRSLELLVSIDPSWSTTAQLSHYVLPPKMQYEREDLPIFIYEMLVSPVPFTRYTPALVSPPRGSEVADDHYFFWSLAKRLGLELRHFDVALDMSRPPTTDELLAISARHAPIGWEALKAEPRGVLLDQEPQYVEPGSPGGAKRFTTMPTDVKSELAGVLGEREEVGPVFRYRLSVRRLRDLSNSAGRSLPEIKRRVPYNLAYLNPGDMRSEGIERGERILIESDHGVITACAEPDPALRSGVVSIAHGFGALPDAKDDDYDESGSSTNLLISLDRDCETINAMPRMSGIPVNLHRAAS